MEERRADDKRINEMHTDIKSILTTMNNLCVQVAVINTKGDSTQKQLDKHETNHGKQAMIIVGVCGILATLVAIFIPYLVQAR
jgi:hypothetical protein